MTTSTAETSAQAQLDQLAEALGEMATALHRVDTGDVYCKLNCGEIESIVAVLRLAGRGPAATFVLHEHAVGDDDPDDVHAELGEQLSARTRAGQACPECDFHHHHEHYRA
ncbi:hypothetical protein ACFVU2_19790 [Leifsonia sp. NPDC058194]|uniref:hypothetical protein n=1 Tax=Leifsonia sp. NPDC058194 TaxID=3346374 RepID=UPI0036DED199